MTDFRITHHWQPRATPHDFDEADFRDWSRPFQAMRRFIACYEGTFVLHLGDLHLSFDLAPDLSTIFEPLPTLLLDLTEPTTSPVFLDFFEQGSDLSLALTRRAQEIEIQFHKGTYHGHRFENLPEHPVVVGAGDFLLEWVRFAHAVLEALVELEPVVAQNKSFQQYLAHLSTVAERAPLPE